MGCDSQGRANTNPRAVVPRSGELTLDIMLSYAVTWHGPFNFSVRLGLKQVVESIIATQERRSVAANQALASFTIRQSESSSSSSAAGFGSSSAGGFSSSSAGGFSSSGGGGGAGGGGGFSSSGGGGGGGFSSSSGGGGGGGGGGYSQMIEQSSSGGGGYILPLHDEWPHPFVNGHPQ